MASRTPEEQHRSEVRTQIMLPVLGGVAFVGLLLVIVILTTSPIKLSIVANCMLSAFTLVPTMLLCLIPTIITVAAAAGSWQLNRSAAPPLRNLRGRITAVMRTIRQRAPQVSQPVVEIQGRFTYFETLLSRLAGRLAPKAGRASQEEHLHGR